MARNGSGTYTIPTTYSDGQTITAAVINSNFADVGTEITNSVAKDGQTTLTGALKLFSGTVSAPGLIFGSDTTTGWYRIGANNYGLSISGTKLLDASSGALAITGTLDVSSTLTAANGLTLSGGTLTLPAGSIETADLASNAVTTAKITDANVTYAKIQNVSAENKILGRSTAGAGAPEEIGLTSPIVLSGGNLTIGGNPSHVLISTTTVSGAASLTITSGISSTYDEYELHVADLQVATDGVIARLQVSTDGGSNYQTTSYLSLTLTPNTADGSDLDQDTSGIQLASSTGNQTIDNSTSYSWRGLIRFWPNGSSARKNFMVDATYMSNGNGFVRLLGGGVWDGGNTAINAVRIIASSGNISGTVRLVGIKNS